MTKQSGVEHRIWALDQAWRLGRAWVEWSQVVTRAWARLSNMLPAPKLKEAVGHPQAEEAAWKGG